MSLSRLEGLLRRELRVETMETKTTTTHTKATGIDVADNNESIDVETPQLATKIVAEQKNDSKLKLDDAMNKANAARMRRKKAWSDHAGSVRAAQACLQCAANAFSAAETSLRAVAETCWAWKKYDKKKWGRTANRLKMNKKLLAMHVELIDKGLLLLEDWTSVESDKENACASNDSSNNSISSNDDEEERIVWLERDHRLQDQLLIAVLKRKLSTKSTTIKGMKAENDQLRFTLTAYEEEIERLKLLLSDDKKKDVGFTRPDPTIASSKNKQARKKQHDSCRAL